MTTMNELNGTYVLDPSHSTLGFVARHAMITKVRGSFTDFTGTGHVDGANPAASDVVVEMQVGSVDTRTADRDGHLKSGHGGSPAERVQKR